MTKKLLFVVNVDWFFASHRLPIALEALNVGYEVHLACAFTDKYEELRAYGIILHSLPMSRSGMSPIGELIAIKSIYKVIKKIKPDVLHAITIKPMIYANLLARVLRVRSRVSSVSGLGYVFINVGFKAKIIRWLISVLYKLGLKNSTAIIFQNTADRDVIREMNVINSSQEILIPGSGIDVQKYIFTTEPPGGPVILFAARFLIDKGINEFVAAAKIVKTEIPEAKIVLVGDIDIGNPKSISKEQLDDWIRGELIEYWGFSENMSATLALSNVVVLPSYREGFPKILIEAAACGRAIVTTDVPGCRDAIMPNQTGILVQPRDEVELAKAILLLIQNVKLRKKFGRAGRKLAEEKYNISDVVQTHLNIYSL